MGNFFHAVAWSLALMPVVGQAQQPDFGKITHSVCIESRGSLQAAGKSLAKVVKEKVRARPTFHPVENAYYIHGSFKTLRAGGTGNLSWLLLAPETEAAVSFCQPTMRETDDGEATLLSLVKALDLEASTAQSERKLTDAEKTLGIDTQPGEQIWNSGLLPNARIRTDLSPPNVPSEEVASDVGKALLGGQKQSVGMVAVFIDFTGERS